MWQVQKHKQIAIPIKGKTQSRLFVSAVAKSVPLSDIVSWSDLASCVLCDIDDDPYDRPHTTSTKAEDDDGDKHTFL